MPTVHRKIFKHVIIYDTDKTTILSDVYCSTYDAIYKFLSANHPHLACPVSTIRAIALGYTVKKYEHIYPFIKITQISKDALPKTQIISAM